MKQLKNLIDKPILEPTQNGTKRGAFSFLKANNSLLKWKGIATLLLVLMSTSSYSQWMLINEDGGVPDANAALEVRDTTHGILFPRLTTVQMNGISPNTAGLLIYNTDSSAVYYNNGSGWANIASTGATQFAVPAGSIIPFGGDTANIPAGFMLCDGSALAQVSYSELYAAIGKAWGGDATNFNLPDLRGRFLRGTDLNAGNDPDAAVRNAINTGGNTGDEIGSVQGDEFGSHNHSGTYNVFYPSGIGGSSHRLHAMTGGVATSGGSVLANGGNETRPVNANVNYIICYSSSIAAAGTNSSVFQGNVSASQLPASAFEDSTRITDADGSAKVEIDGSDNILFTNGSSESARFNSSGFLGLNNNNPQSLLDVGGTAIIDSLRIYNAYALPGDDGTNGQVMQTDGNGKAEWKTPVSSADNLGDHKATQILQLNGNKISGDGDNEGISVDNSGKVVVSVAAGSSGAGNEVLRTNGDIWTDGQGTGLYMSNSSIGITGNTTNSGDMRFKTDGNDRVRILKTGQVGIGTNSPQVPLQIQGGNDASLNATNGYMVIGNTSSTNLVFDNNEILARDNGATSFLALNANGGAISMHAGINDVSRWGVFLDDGNFLLGDTITANRAKLRVAGKVLADTLSILGGVEFPTSIGTNNQVLTADGSGGSSWESPTPSPWTVSGSDVYRSSGSVGVGTSSPSNLLHVFQGAGADVMGRFEKTTNGEDAALEIVGARQGATSTADIAYVDLKNYDANEGSGTEFIMSRITGFVSGNSGQRGGLKMYINNGTSGVGLTQGMKINPDGQVTLGTSTLPALLQMPSGNSYSMNIKASSSMTQDVTYTFPVDDGDANEMLTTDGSGVLSWSVPASSPWTESGTDVYRSSGFVGIGTTSPTGQLTIFGDSSSALTLKSGDNTKNHGIAFQNLGSNYTWSIHRADAGSNDADLVFSGGDGKSNINSLDERMRITHDGNIGIGTAIPTAALQVNAAPPANASSGQFQIDESTSGNSMMLGRTQTYGYVQTQNSEPLALNPISNNVGIGTTAPVSELHVDGTGTFDIAQSNGYGVSVRRNTDQSKVVDLFTGGGKNGNISVYNSAGVEIVRINAGASNTTFNGTGNFGFGTDSPQSKIHANSSNSSTALQLTNNTSGATGGDGFHLSIDANNALIQNKESGDIEFNTNSADRMIIKANGDVGIGTTSPSYDLDVVGNINASLTVRAAGVALISDKRYKTNISPLNNTLASLELLQGVYHNWDTLNFPKEYFPKGRALGVIAQDMQKIYPELVYENSDGYLAVDYAKFSAVLLEAIKEQQTQIETLEAKVESENSKVNNQKVQLDEVNAKLAEQQTQISLIQQMLNEGRTEK
ncbi:MAG: tail fiber protein [Salibacteraceae bacterium]